ncbi:TPA: prolyl oligopeptidase family serine peptidase, partial [Candidatus Woesearchaeota archaeon]|nr:prolyl oligopeptidase family serine peptidase [Candidatus Woesearchaeota archaeon]
QLIKKGYIDHYRHGRINKAFIQHLKRYDMKEEIAKLKCPILLLHGANDFQVRSASCKELFFAANEPKRFEITDDADHWFREPQHREHLIGLTISWINRHIKEMKTFKSETTERRSRSRLV